MTDSLFFKPRRDSAVFPPPYSWCALTAPDAAYDVIADALDSLLDDNIAPSEAQFAGANRLWTPGQNRLDRRFWSRPLAPGVRFNDSRLWGSTRFIEDNADNNAIAICGMRLFSNEGELLRTLLAVGDNGSGTEIGTTTVSRVFAQDAVLADFVAGGGEVLELSMGFTDVAGTTPEARSVYGGDLIDVYPTSVEGSSAAYAGFVRITNVSQINGAGVGAPGLLAGVSPFAWRPRSWGAA